MLPIHGNRVTCPWWGHSVNVWHPEEGCFGVCGFCEGSDKPSRNVWCSFRSSGLANNRPPGRK